MNSRSLPTWTIAIVVLVVLQTVTATLGRIVPVVSPAFMAEFGWDQSWIGYISAGNVVGAVFLITAGLGLAYRFGAMCLLQITLIVGAVSLVFYVVPSMLLALLASVMIGLSNGAANPAGSEIIQRFTPPAHRNVVFSIKQAGVPLGGVISGLTVPLLVDAVGWRMTLVIAAAVGVVVTALTWPFRTQIDPPRDREIATPLISLRLTDIAGPMRSLSRRPGLWAISWVGCLLAIPQACWVTFAATYLVVALGLSLSVAGLVYAVMQASSVIGRVLMGWIADHVASTNTTLIVASVASAVSTILFGLVGTDWPTWGLLLLAAFAGISVSGWNGVQLAEVAHLSPPALVAETAAGSVILVYASNMLGPVGFAAIVTLTGHFDWAFIVSGAFSLLCLPLLWGIDHRQEPG